MRNWSFQNRTSWFRSLFFRNITNYIFIEDNPGGGGDGAAPSSKDQPPRGSLHSIRKGSYDVKSLASESGHSLRRQSLAKLNSLPIEAPITKVITLLYSAHEQSSPSIQAQLDKVVDILRSTELYSPQLKENRIRPDDPVTVDLISALLSVSNNPYFFARHIGTYLSRLWLYFQFLICAEYMR